MNYNNDYYNHYDHFVYFDCFVNDVAKRPPSKTKLYIFAINELIYVCFIQYQSWYDHNKTAE